MPEEIARLLGDSTNIIGTVLQVLTDGQSPSFRVEGEMGQFAGSLDLGADGFRVEIEAKHSDEFKVVMQAVSEYKNAGDRQQYEKLAVGYDRSKYPGVGERRNGRGQNTVRL